MANNHSKALRELAASNVGMTDKQKAECSELADQVEAAENAGHPAAAEAGVVGSDLSVFIKNISTLGFWPAFVQFVKDIFNIKT